MADDSHNSPRIQTPDEWEALVLTTCIGMIRSAILHSSGKVTREDAEELMDVLTEEMVRLALESFTAVLSGPMSDIAVRHPSYREPSLSAAARLLHRLDMGEPVPMMIAKARSATDRLHQQYDPDFKPGDEP